MASFHPTKRLKLILESARTRERNASVKDAWAGIFGIDRSATRVLMNLLSDTIDLVEISRSKVEALPAIDGHLIEVPFAKISSLFSPVNFDATWGPYVDHIDDMTIYAISMFENLISASSSMVEAEVEKSTLDQLFGVVETTTKALLEADIDPGLKGDLIRHLEAIRRAILAYRVRGVEGLRTAFEGGVGSLIVNQAEVTKSKGNGALRSFLELLRNLDMLTSVAVNSKQLFAPMVKALLGMEDQS